MIKTINYHLNNNYLVLSSNNISSKLFAENSLIAIKMSDNKLPFGTIVKSLKVNKKDNYYKTICILTSLNNPNASYSEIITSEVIDGGNLTINSPYNDMTAIANELSIYLLYMKNILTIHASCFVQNEIGYIFLGRSNSGKSTSVKMISKLFTSGKIIADDHIHICAEKSSILLSCPIWDAENKSKEVNKWYIVKKIRLICLDKIGMNGLIDLLRFTVAYSYHDSIDDVIYSFINKIYYIAEDWIDIYNCEYQSWESVRKIINER
ncbi:hypothetical protein [Proteiniborus sp. MB09-C3]|uniref:hypothetical protein n=1 Tax=Proteiniborus sp. MB09-C3 TaxID=3050072 RepID=UPI002552721D|nr:hypothetical protein [Proteiniborus sp. MB09-C3]WIV11342.1 hypothetical protein QO263_14450 [Proteiniborus sp. MB09-C3]